MPPVKVVVVDNHQLVLDGVSRIIEDGSDLSVVATAHDGVAALDQVKLHSPDILLTEIHMPRMGGIEVSKIIQRRHPRTKVVILTSFESPAFVVAAIRAGARGYLTKAMAAHELRSAIITVHREGVILPSRILHHLMQAVSRPADLEDDPLACLTAREREILFLLTLEYETDDVARFLMISPKTVRNCLSRIYAKLGTRNRLQTVLFAKRTLAHPDRQEAPEPGQAPS